ncbi:structural maintenance of chromosome complex subunit SmcA [Venturia nashicola]|uniref:Structural maintenance of chromosomes protein 5 n=1 Tax=Venturia nashicola TaxID=86259 RepID=A0A4Z1PE87_9PEZI|nr:structural maintenance of chromosome complex subunit SmcA [Venturia nashicola]
MPQRRQRDDDDEDSDEGSGSQSSKRARLTPEEESDEDEDAGQLLPDSYRRSPRAARTRIAPREPHKPGAIVRIKVKDFVTYSAAEFLCGPSLNMIIGPNGTGKSTLVCAICLGLGARTSVLGRAKDISEYVKHGCDTAEIEIELQKTERMDQNPIIRHTIKREGNKSAWQLNGRTTTHKEVLSFVKAFNIQIDNLCQFLPQDRVADFSKMTSIEKLEETQKAAAHPRLIAWHNELKNLGTERKKFASDQDQSKTHLEQLQKRQDAQRADVERMTERKNLQDKVSVLEACRPALQYASAKKEYDDARVEKSRAMAELEELRVQVEPALENVRAKEAYRAQVQGFVRVRKQAVENGEAVANRSRAAVDNFKQLIDQFEGERESEIKSFQIGREKAKRTEHQLTVLRNRVNNEEPIEFNAADFNERIRAKQAEYNANYNLGTETTNKIQDLDAQRRQARQQRKELLEKIASLQSQSGQQMAKLSRVSKDTAKAVNWLKSNQNKFKEPIVGPALIECSVKDKRYAAAIESKMQKSDWCGLVATNKEDWNTLRKYLTGSGPESLKLTDIYIRVANRSMDQWQSISSQECATMGLDCMAIDQIEGPDRLLSALCDSSKFHTTGLSLREITNDQFKRIENSSIESWVAGQTTYKIIRRREYGHSSTSTNRIRPNAQYWTGEDTIDTEAQRTYQAEIFEVEGDLATMEQELESLKEQRATITEACNRAKEEKRSLEVEKADRQKAYTEFQSLPRKINELEEEQAGQESRKRDFRARIKDIDAKKEDNTMKRGEEAIKYAALAGDLRKLHVDLFEAEIWLIEANSEVSVLEERSSSVRQMLKLREQELVQLVDRVKSAKDIAARYLQQYRQAQAGFDEDSPIIQEWLNTEKTIQDLDNEIDATKNRIELLHGGNPAVIQAFETREVEIAKLTERVANFDADLEKMSQKIATIREQWEPELDGIVAKISEAFTFNFQMIKCAGEVTVVKDEDDFSKWELQLKAKFRENEQMTIIDNHRQSGGERAVATIFYLMALQSLARSPFRVVDEINQGMDQRNERIVHSRMVDIACNGDTSQYFLVTPKLLNGLKYHEKMVVHCIYSSETMPADNRGMDLASLAKLALRVAGKAM